MDSGRPRPRQKRGTPLTDSQPTASGAAGSTDWTADNVRANIGPAPTCPLCRRTTTAVFYQPHPFKPEQFAGWSCNPCREHIASRAYIPALAAISGGLFEAAASYMVAGWYIVPIRRGKHAGSVLGKKWPEKSIREMWVLRKYVRERNVDQHGLALHVGRSGAVAFDVDTPANVPKVLRDAIERDQPPFQSTRRDDPDRGHYPWALPEGVMVGNGLGQLATDEPWGEVRGRNGIIVVQPTVHIKPEGHYQWRRSGRLPELPKDLGRALLRPARRHAPGGFAHHRLYETRRADGLLTNLRQTPEGERNTMLFWTACRFGEMVAEGRIDPDMIHETLVDISGELGLPVSEATATTSSGLSTGAWAWSE